MYDISVVFEIEEDIIEVFLGFGLVDDDGGVNFFVEFGFFFFDGGYDYVINIISG